MTRLGSIDTGSHLDWLATAARTAHVAVGITHLRSGALIEVNDAFCRLFRYRRDECLGRTPLELGLWVDPAARERMLEGARRVDGVSQFEARYRNRQGEIGDMEVSARVVHDEAGESYLIGFLTDVTDRREFVGGLRAAQARLDVVLRASGVLVFRQDAALRYTWVANPVLGVRADEVIGRTDDELLGAEAAAPLVAIKRRVLDTGRPERRDVWVANNGQLGCFDMVVEPERDEAGRVVGLLCSAQDITQRMTTPPSVPVQAIQGMASLIGREPLSERQAQRLQRIDQAVARLARPTSAAPSVEQLRARHAGARVVVAEHNPVLRELAGALLQEAGLRVTYAGDGVEAFRVTLQLAPALLLLDMELPQRGGVAAARAVRTMVQRRLPIIAMLSAGSPIGAALALDADLDDVIDKPVAVPALYDKLLRWLDAP